MWLLRTQGLNGWMHLKPWYCWNALQFSDDVGWKCIIRLKNKPNSTFAGPFHHSWTKYTFGRILLHIIQHLQADWSWERSTVVHAALLLYLCVESTSILQVLCIQEDDQQQERVHRSVIRNSLGGSVGMLSTESNLNICTTVWTTYAWACIFGGTHVSHVVWPKKATSFDDQQKSVKWVQHVPRRNHFRLEIQPFLGETSHVHLRSTHLN